MSSNGIGTMVPMTVQVELAHAATSVLARQAGVDVIVLKGPGMDPSVASADRGSSDVDVLVRPDQLNRWLRLLASHGWTALDRFATGSSFEHSQTFAHEVWGHMDVHRFVPGVGLAPEDAFDQLQESCIEVPLAGVPCRLPDPASQALILLLHAARSHGSSRAQQDIDHAWTRAAPERRAAILSLVEKFDAHVGWAALTGELDKFASDPAYRLWVVASRGGSRTQEWRARIALAPTLGEKAKVAARALLVNTDHLAIVLGRRPTRAEVIQEFVGRFRLGFLELTHRARGRT